MMDLLIMIWIVIDMVLFLILISPLRKQVTKQPNEMPKHSIESVNGLGERVLDILSQVCILAPLTLLIYVLILLIPDIVITCLLRWYIGVFIVALYPMLHSWIKDNHFKLKSFWNVSLVIIAVTFSMVGFAVDTEKEELIIQHRTVINLLITIYVTVFLVVLFKTFKEKKRYGIKKLPKKGIRKDLYYRTPRLEVNISNIELIEYCEKYFDEYMKEYRKIKDLHAIEYVNLSGIYREFWYSKTAHFMKIFVVISVLLTVISMSFNMSYKPFVVVGLLIVFEVLISIYKHVDLECLYKIGIRYVYDEWGYYLTLTKKNKFIGNVQMLEKSKYHKYVQSFLDIAALCRAVAFNDQIEGKDNICIISSNLNDLFTSYTDYKEKKSWTMIIPLWIAALFEFQVAGQIDEGVKTTLLMSVDECVRVEICIFLQSFWSDIERKKLENGIFDFVQRFETELFC